MASLQPMEGQEDVLNLSSRSNRMAWQQPDDIYEPADGAEGVPSPRLAPSIYEDGTTLPEAMQGESRHFGQDIERRRVGNEQVGFYDHFKGGIRAIWRTKESDNVRYDGMLYARTMIRELTFYGLFLTILCFIAFYSTSSTVYRFTQTIKDTFIDKTGPAFYKSFRDVSDMEDIWHYMEGPLLNGLYFGKGYNGMRENYTAFIHHENRLLGKPRLRMLKVRMNAECSIPGQMEKLNVTTCYSEYGPDAAIEKAGSVNLGANNTAWRYFEPEELGVGGYSGKISWYGGGGYYADLDIDRFESKAQISYLKQQRWINRETRVLFIDFSVYNANLNLFSVVKLVFELPVTGGVLPSYEITTMQLIKYLDSGDHLVLILELIFCLFIVYYCVEEAIEICRHGWGYFRSFWNVLDVVVILASIFCITYSVLCQTVIEDKLSVLLSNPWQYVNFERIAFAQRRFNDAVAVLVFFAWIKLFKYISLSRAMHQICETMTRCRSELGLFSIIFCVLFMAYAHTGYLLFGNTMEGYRSLPICFFTLMRMIFGDFDYAAMERSHSILGPVYFLTFVFFVFILLLNVFLAIVNDAYGEVKDELTGRPEKVGMAGYFTMAYKKALKKINLQQSRGRDIHEALLAADENKDLTVDYDEWRREMTKRGYAEGEIEAIFNKYDTDNNGTLGIGEQRRMEDDFEKGLLFSTDETVAQRAALDDNDIRLRDTRLIGQRTLRPVTRPEFAVTALSVTRTEEKLMRLFDQLDITMARLHTAEKQKIDHLDKIVNIIAQANQGQDMVATERLEIIRSGLQTELDRFVDETLEE